MVHIAMLGDRDDTKVTHRALNVLAERCSPDVRFEWVPTHAAHAGSLTAFDGVWAVPGTPYADEGSVQAVLRERREAGLPTLGTCGGFQHLVLEVALNLAGITGASHAETAPDGAALVVRGLACRLVGEVRPVTAVPGTRVAAICGTKPFDGFHFCGYGVAPEFLPALEAVGLRVSAHAPDAGVEAVELVGHPFHVGTLFQPQMASAEGGPLHPVVLAFVEACASP